MDAHDLTHFLGYPGLDVPGNHPYAPELGLLNLVILGAIDYIHDPDIHLADGAIGRSIRRFPPKGMKGILFSALVVLGTRPSDDQFADLLTIIGEQALAKTARFTQREVQELQRLNEKLKPSSFKAQVAQFRVKDPKKPTTTEKPDWIQMELGNDVITVLCLSPKKPSAAWQKKLATIQVPLAGLIPTLMSLPPELTDEQKTIASGLVSYAIHINPVQSAGLYVALAGFGVDDLLLNYCFDMIRLTENLEALCSLAVILPRGPKASAVLKQLKKLSNCQDSNEIFLKHLPPTISCKLDEFSAHFDSDQASAPQQVPTINSSTGLELSSVQKRFVSAQKAIRASHRAILENQCCNPTEFTFSEWAHLFCNHPARASMTNSLVWKFDHDLAIFQNDAWITPEGKEIHPERAESIKLWHPLTSGPGTTEVWREFIIEHEIKQAFKQAFREVYILTDAERNTRDHSRRFTGHVLKMDQFLALQRTKGWKSKETYYFFGSDSDDAKKDFPGWNISAHFSFKQAEENFINFTEERLALVGTQFLWFEREGQKLSLDSVPQHLFSEVMRDVDMFVSVTSIGTDPQRAINDPNAGAGSIWHRMAFGELLPSAQTRADYLEMLLPKLGLENLRVEGKFLLVSGKLHRYKIHLGSSNILIQPNDQYLCIVGKPSGSKSNLTFDGDSTLSLIISKAMMLLSDDKITDPTILSQIRGI